ncbi:uncharacterized protein HKW66_Vig0116310 [Vigna angularis]|uniref:Uncharacterized protein n=1 Tax=Phaseolus angularis TaxID=3914 RepID=A0A8T0KZ56_PHAAN|nr:uncharacterized protein HKW66_Vig0116310 [Vigna angularis]
MASSSSRRKWKVAWIARNANPTSWIVDEDIRRKLFCLRKIKIVVSHRYLKLAIVGSFTTQVRVLVEGLRGRVRGRVLLVVVVYYSYHRGRLSRGRPGGRGVPNIVNVGQQGGGDKKTNAYVRGAGEVYLSDLARKKRTKLRDEVELRDCGFRID